MPGPKGRPNVEVTDSHKRVRLVEPAEFVWRYDGDLYRLPVPADGHGAEPSIIGVPAPVTLAVGAYAAVLLVLMWFGWDPSWWFFAPVFLEIALDAPRILFAMFADRFDFLEVAIAHDYTYRKDGDVVYWLNGEEKNRFGLSRREADAVMASDPDDPTALQWIAWAYVRILGWYKWHGWDESIIEVAQ